MIHFLVDFRVGFAGEFLSKILHSVKFVLALKIVATNLTLENMAVVERLFTNSQ